MGPKSEPPIEPEPEQTGKKKVEPLPIFVFDLIVTNVESNDTEFSNKDELKITANVFKKSIVLSPSQINASDFKDGAGQEFEKDPKDVRKVVGDCGMSFTVMYSNKTIGTAQASFPPSLVDTIQKDMEELVHSGTLNLVRGPKVTGKLEFLCRLVIKSLAEEGESECKRNMDKSISPQDIMFVMGESQVCPAACEPCMDPFGDLFGDDGGDEHVQMDLDRYRSEGGGIKPYQMMTDNGSGIPACCELKKMALEYERMIDTVTKSTGGPPPRPPCREPDDSALFGMSPCRFRPEPPICVDMPEPPTMPCFVYLPATQNQPPDFVDKNLLPVPIADCDGQKTDIKPIRFCPVCLTNMSWLPKFANCPKCGIKPMPVVEERHKAKKLTADQILLEYLGKQPKALDDYCVDPCEKAKQAKAENEDDECPPCRCTCKAGKMCAHCRIRKQCADIFKPERLEPKCPKVEPKDSEDYCVVNKSSEDCRPYLAKVFSELRDLYDIKDTKKMSELDENCDRAVPKKDKPENQEAKKVKDEAVASPSSKPAYIPSNHKGEISSRHKRCLQESGYVSRNHGWAWSKSFEAKKLGWRPGAIRKPIKNLMKFFLERTPQDNAFNKAKEVEALQREKELSAPVLNVCKKNGAIYITLRPLSTLGVRQAPITFRIVKSDLAVALREIKRKLKDKGYRKCTCHRSLMLCTCRDGLEKAHLQRALNKECRRHCIPPAGEHLVLTDTSESDMEFDFDVTPPAGTKQPYQPPKPQTVNHGTQFSKKDTVPPPPKYPMQIPPYYRAFDCAVGDRYMGTAFGLPDELVFEDGVFGRAGGGPHGLNPMPCGRSRLQAAWGAGGGAGRGRGRGRGGGMGMGMFMGPDQDKDKSKKGKSGPIPVRYPKRFLKPGEDAAKAAKQAAKDELERKKKGIDMVKYLEEKGTLVRPWNPDEGKDTRPRPQGGKAIGADGLTDGQRKRRMLLAQPPPPLCSIPRRGKGYNPCRDAGCCCYDIVC